MLRGHRYRAALDPQQQQYSEQVAAICRAVWNLALDQRQADDRFATGRGRSYRRRVDYYSQRAELVRLKASEPWLSEAPSHCLLETLRDLDKACGTHGPKKVHFRSKRGKHKWEASFRFPDAKQIGEVKRRNKRWAEVRLPKLGRVRFRWTRDLNGEVRNVTLQRKAEAWFLSFCVDDGCAEPAANGLGAVGVDRGVIVALATSDGELLNRRTCSDGEVKHLRRLQQQFARQKKGSNRGKRTVRAMHGLQHRIACRRHDFVHQTAHHLTTSYGLVIIEDLRIANMTRSAKGTLEQPGRNVRAKAGLNRAILDKGWGNQRLALGWHGLKNGCIVVAVPAAFTSQTCSACGYRSAASRESQARYRCRACGMVEHADVNAARNILAAGLAVTARGDFGITRSMKREPPKTLVACAAD
jgi:transposase